MGIRELTRRLKKKTLQEWMKEYKKHPFGYGTWFSEEWGRAWAWKEAGLSDEDILRNDIFDHLPKDDDASTDSYTYPSPQDAIDALEVALRQLGEIE